MRTFDPILLDTNILVYVHQALSPFHSQARAILERGLKEEVVLCICPQILMEFYSTITNPKRVTDPVSQEEATIEIEKYFTSRKILKIYPQVDTLKRTIQLLKIYQVKQMVIFDLQLVATMLSNKIKRLYTFNRDDFSKFKEIEALEP